MSPTTNRREGRWKVPKRLRQLIQILLALFVVNTFVLPLLSGTRDALQLVGDLNPFLLVAGAAAEVASLAAVAHLVRTLLPPRASSRPPCSWRSCSPPWWHRSR